ncbi:hypothetical protein D3C80_1332230 [compost metagenome]
MCAKNQIVFRIRADQIYCRIGSDKYIGVLSAVRSINHDGIVESGNISKIIDNGLIGAGVRCKCRSLVSCPVHIQGFIGNVDDDAFFVFIQNGNHIAVGPPGRTRNQFIRIIFTGEIMQFQDDNQFVLNAFTDNAVQSNIIIVDICSGIT